MWSFTNVHVHRFWNGLEIVSHVGYMYARPSCTDNSIINITLSQGYLLATLCDNLVTTCTMIRDIIIFIEILLFIDHLAGHLKL